MFMSRLRRSKRSKKGRDEAAASVFIGEEVQLRVDCGNFDRDVINVGIF